MSQKAAKNSGGDDQSALIAAAKPTDHTSGLVMLHPWVAGLAPGDIRLWHDGPAGRITPLLDKLILPADGWQPVLISGCGGWGMNLSLAYACAERPLGKGHLVICQVDLAGRTATNPAARTLADALLGAPNPFINPT
jgi:hypothetical protein